MLFSGANLQETIIRLIISLPAILIALTVHEVCHAYAAYKLGDPTARNLGRLSLNPMKHIDILGFIMLLVAGFGWAKPVPINSRYFKKARRDIVIVSLAGPFSNLILAFFGMIIFRITEISIKNNYTAILTMSGYMQNLIVLTESFLYLFVMLNLGLAVFNLLPIPPLDGSRLLTVILPAKWANFVFMYERYIQIALFVLLYFGVMTNVISGARSLLYNAINWLIDLIPFLKL